MGMGFRRRVRMFSLDQTTSQAREIHFRPELFSYGDTGVDTRQLEGQSDLGFAGFRVFKAPELARRVYNSPFPLVDITITPDDEIMQHRRIAILELLQKHIRQRDLMLLLEQLVTLIDEGYTSGSQLVAMQNYMLQRGHTEQADLFYGVLRDRETGGESMMTLAQWFEEKGIEKGIQQGRQEERQEFALRLLSKGMSREDVAEMENLPLAEIDKVINLI